jgi:hypothetical protein
MTLETPESIRRLQRKLYLKAKAEPAYRGCGGLCEIEQFRVPVQAGEPERVLVRR